MIARSDLARSALRAEERLARVGHDPLERPAAIASGARHVVERVDPLDGLPERPPAREGVGDEPVERHLSDPTGGIVQDPTEADLVRGVERELEVREDVLHLLSLEELRAADDAVGDSLFAQRLLEQPRLPVRAVQHRDVARTLPLLAKEAADLPSDPRGLDLRRGRDRDADRATPGPLGEELLAPLGVRALGDDRVRDREDRRNRAIVLLELHDARPLEVLLEVEDVAHVGAAPAVDGLIVVAHGAHVAAIAAEQAQHLELRAVRVLVLVDEHVQRLALPPRADVLSLAPEARDLADEIVEVEGAVLTQG